jgi:hypothetical protein
MPNPQQPSFDHEATLEELAGVGKNRRFDEVIDDDEVENIQVICKRGDEEIPLPSLTGVNPSLNRTRNGIPLHVDWLKSSAALEFAL